jgi:glucose dehydrogenase
MRRGAPFLLLLGIIAAAPAVSQPAGERVRQVDTAFIAENARTGRDWPSYGLSHGENRFSPLA